jgi:DNA-binding transcriptional MerR regulator
MIGTPFAEQHGVSVRTVHRWAETGVIDPPERIRGRNYLPADTEPRRDGEAA